MEDSPPALLERYQTSVQVAADTTRAAVRSFGERQRRGALTQERLGKAVHVISGVRSRFAAVSAEHAALGSPEGDLSRRLRDAADAMARVGMLESICREDGSDVSEEMVTRLERSVEEATGAVENAAECLHATSRTVGAARSRAEDARRNLGRLAQHAAGLGARNDAAGAPRDDASAAVERMASLLSGGLALAETASATTNPPEASVAALAAAVDSVRRAIAEADSLLRARDLKREQMHLLGALRDVTARVDGAVASLDATRGALAAARETYGKTSKTVEGKIAAADGLLGATARLRATVTEAGDVRAALATETGPTTPCELSNASMQLMNELVACGQPVEEAAAAAAREVKTFGEVMARAARDALAAGVVAARAELGRTRDRLDDLRRLHGTVTSDDRGVSAKLDAAAAAVTSASTLEGLIVGGAGGIAEVAAPLGERFMSAVGACHSAVEAAGSAVTSDVSRSKNALRSKRSETDAELDAVDARARKLNTANAAAGSPTDGASMLITKLVRARARAARGVVVVASLRRGVCIYVCVCLRATLRVDVR